MASLSHLYSRGLDAAMGTYANFQQETGYTRDISGGGMCAIVATVFAWLLVLIVVCYWLCLPGKMGKESPST